MKIAVASDDGLSISTHFGRSAGFVIFVAENDEIVKSDYRQNTSGHHHEGECNHEQGHEQPHGQHSHNGFLSSLDGCDVIICRGMGRRAIVDLKANGIAVAITSEPVDVATAAKLYAQGKLPSSDESVCCKH